MVLRAAHSLFLSPGVQSSSFNLPVGRRRSNPADFYLFSSLIVKMTKSSPSDHLLLLCSCIFIIASALVISADATSLDHQELMNGTWTPMKAAASCQGSVAECLGGGEFSMDSEINRRILATSNYISYGALQRNTVPCSRRGASYYNCQPGAEANPYTRGCSIITRCRS